MKISRRSFFKAGLALPVVTWSGRTLRISVRKDSSFDPWVEVHADNLRRNVAEIQKRVQSRPVLAVIKNNGYGLGLLNVARALEPLNAIAGFAVVKLQEAATLRDEGIRKSILLMGPFDEQDLEELVVQEITPMVYTPLGSILDRVSRKLQRPIPLHICIDTGIGRVGVPYARAASFVRDLAARKSVRVEGIMMTFTEDPEFDKEQLRRFQSLCVALESEGIDLGKKHAASSFGLFQHPQAFLDMVRPGMAIFGIYPEQEFRSSGVIDLRPAVALRTRVLYVKPLRRGESAGYNRAFVADRDVWVATIPVGHADGVPRVATNGARVRIGDNLYPIVAISASHCILKVESESEVSIGQVATIFDWQDGSRPEDVAAACKSSVYDLTMHLNALLPRRIL